MDKRVIHYLTKFPNRIFVSLVIEKTKKKSM